MLSTRLLLPLALAFAAADLAFPQSTPLFVNGGFEDGTFTGWTLDYGFYQGSGVITWGQAPHGLHAVIGAGELQPGQTLAVDPYDGLRMARINDIFGGTHATLLTQTGTVLQEHLDEGGILYVQWGAMLVDPLHPLTAQPFFHIEVLRNGSVLDLFEANATDAANQGWIDAGQAGGELWYKADVYSVDIGMLAVGDQLTVRMFVADCAFGGHGGFAFLDGIGTTPPAQSIVLTPASATLPLGANHTVTAAVTDGFGNPIVGTSVTFSVTDGPNLGTTGMDVTDASGQAGFTYAGLAAGDDTIQGCFLDAALNTVCDDAVASWVDACGHGSIERKLTSPAGPTDLFGSWVDIDGDVAVVASSGTFSQTLAHVYERDDGGTPGMFLDDTWILRAALDSPAGSSALGVALEGDTVVVVKTTSLEVFVRPTAGWQDMTTPTAVLGGGSFGQKVGISADVIVGGGEVATNQALVYVKPAAGWANVSAPTTTLSCTSDTGEFGTYIAIDGDLIAAGAYQDVPLGGSLFRGSAYVFAKPAGGWGATPTLVESAKLEPSGSPGGINFGAGVAVDGDYVLVAAVSGGPAYLYRKPAVGGWSGTLTEIAQLSPSTPASRFGESPALEDGVALLGSSVEKVFCFVRSGPEWTSMTESGVLTSSDNTPGDAFGRTNALSQGTTFVGAGNDDGGRGSAYVFNAGDSLAPVLVCPTDFRVVDAKGGTPGETVQYTVTATDNCDPSPTVICTPPSGSFFPRGTTTVTCTATDLSGNLAVCTFQVVVQPSVRRAP